MFKFKIYKSPITGFVYVNNGNLSFPEDFSYTRSGDFFTIKRSNTPFSECDSVRFSEILGDDGLGNDISFTNANDLQSYLDDVITQDPVTSGTDGQDGADGLSAYMIAVANGFVGSESEWLSSLVGADGQDGQGGADGAQGIQGIAGNDGSDGINGTDGVDGLSAYQLAVSEGFVGTLQEWLDSLQGVDGQDGADGREIEVRINVLVLEWRYIGDLVWIPLGTVVGTNGSDGQDGTNGSDGQDGREIEIQINGVDLEWRYVGEPSFTSLGRVVGQDGQDGAQGIQGVAGADGQGVPAGGTAGQVLEKIDNTDYNTLWVTPSSGGGLSKTIAGYRCITPQNVNSSTAGMTISWDDVTDRRQDSGISIDVTNQNVTLAGTPDHVEIELNLKVAIADTTNAQRPNQIVRVVRSDGRVIASSATGYIRDASDHEESSYNLSATDYSPIADASYSITCSRETANAGVVSLNISETQLVVKSYS